MKDKNIISAIVGSVFFAIPYLTLSVPIIPSLAIGSAAFLAGELVLKSKDKDEITLQDLNKTIKQAELQNNHIKKMIPNICDQDLKQNLTEITINVKKIIDTIKKKPTKAESINNFFDYYLPVTIKIIDRYDNIENQCLEGEDSQDFQKKTKQIITEINKAFKTILNQLYTSDIVDTNAEMQVVSAMLKADGFNDKEINIKNKEDKNG